MEKAVWGTDYDYRSDKEYKLPACPKCDNYYGMNGLYRVGKLGKCLNCNELYVLDEEMSKWFDEREGHKEETDECLMCGKKTMVSKMRKNPVTLKWERTCGQCTSCGSRYLV